MFQNLVTKALNKINHPNNFINSSEPIHIQLQKCWDRMLTCYDINHIEEIELSTTNSYLNHLTLVIQKNSRKEGTISEFLNNERCLSILIGYGKSDTPSGMMLSIVDFLITTLPYLPSLPLNDPNLPAAIHSLLLMVHTRIIKYFKDPSLILNQNNQLTQLNHLMIKYNNLIQRYFGILPQIKEEAKIIRWLGLAQNTTVKIPIVYLPLEILLNQLPPNQPHEPNLINNFQKLEKLNLVGIKQLIQLNYYKEIESIIVNIVDKTIESYLKLITNISTPKSIQKVDSFKFKHESRKLDQLEGNYFRWLEYLFRWWHQIVAMAHKFKKWDLMNSIIGQFEVNFLQAVLIPSLFTSEELTSHRLPYLIHLIQITHHPIVYQVWSRVLLCQFHPIKVPFLHHLTSLISPNLDAKQPSSLNLHYFNLIITLLNNGQLSHFFQIKATTRNETLDNQTITNQLPLQLICQCLLAGIHQLVPDEMPDHDEHFLNLLFHSNPINQQSHHLDLINQNEVNVTNESIIVPLPLIPLLMTWLNELFDFHPMEVLLITQIYSNLLNLAPISILEQLLGYGAEGDYGKFPPSLFHCLDTLRHSTRNDEVRWTIVVEFFKEVLVGLVIRNHCLRFHLQSLSDSDSD